MPDAFDSLPPWDAATWFQTPKETFFANATNGTKIASADPQRVAIIFCVSGGGVGQVSINPAGSTGRGLTFTGNSGALILRFADVGPLVQGDFYCVTLSSSPITVVEILLRDWPRPRRPATVRRTASDKANPSQSG